MERMVFSQPLGSVPENDSHSEKKPLPIFDPPAYNVGSF